MEEPDQNLDLESKRVYLSFLNHLRSEEKAVLVITGRMESAIETADVAYILDDTGLRTIEVGADANLQASEDAKEKVAANPVKLEKIPSKVNEKIVLFHPLEIDYIESQDGQSFLHVKEEAFPCTFTLQQLEQRLFPFGFFRCHRSYLVNLQKVREVMTWTRNSYSLILENKQKTTIPLSKSKMAELKELLGI
ncbi:Sensory transduction protein LytT [Lentibacillus sp. JNUCC-1]|uniref:LytTR family DNA-binding domain-containing protein n=1 Tax=Lentibacillus sp. JNUCC-1 TaxID=2654513 RepID=UPI001323E481|nr:LytTR family DNA-binding domain-containing protein [Lentibacillus sp. JNUCC-1]MUV38122.1 Sensory transduction protein LytT [Lentibacillus sp. JNUCC-1]